MLTLYHAGTSDRARRIVSHGFDESDEVTLDSHVLTGVICCGTVCAMAGIRDGERFFIDGVLEIDVDASEPELERFADRLDGTRTGWPTGDYWFPASFLRERVRGVREIDTAPLLESEAFWKDWADYWERREALAALDKP